MEAPNNAGAPSFNRGTTPRDRRTFQLPTLERPRLVLEGLALHVVDPVEEARRLLVRLEGRGS